jgi:hypothetical protein
MGVGFAAPEEEYGQGESESSKRERYVVGVIKAGLLYPEPRPRLTPPWETRPPLTSVHVLKSVPGHHRCMCNDGASELRFGH